MLSACLYNTTLVLAAVTNDLLISIASHSWLPTYTEAEECMIVEKSAFVPDLAAIS
jgi:hypothetical protein